MTRKEQNIILDRLNKLQLTVDYNNDLYRQTGTNSTIHTPTFIGLCCLASVVLL